MLQKIDEAIKRMNNADKVLNVLLETMGYKTSSNFHFVDGNDDYDAEYTIEIENEKHTLLGIKVLREYDEQKIVMQHLKYWNRNDVPFSIFVLPSEIRIYNNFTVGKRKLLFKTGSKKNEIFDWFTDSNIMNGLLWEKLESITSKNNRVDKYLLKNLRNTITVLDSKYKMQLDVSYNFLAQCIFVKYLEDREMLTKTAFATYGVDDFEGLLSLENKKYIQKFFSDMKTRFNGDMFDGSAIDGLTREQICIVKDFLAAGEIYTDGSVQLSLLKYDFSKIPIELISNIYETFFNLEDSLKNRKTSSQNGAFYTPYYLADFMNDRCFEKYTGRDIPIILDPACGSGVFLVGAFKRIVEEKRKKNGRILPDELREILVHNIYGVDKNLKALKLACFSLYIALLEFMTPRDILENKFKFPNLIGQTLLEKNFFESDIENRGICADIIIGNPPWLSDSDTLHNEYCRQRNIPISDMQIAQSFIVRVKDFASNGAIISLIVTNSIFMNENADEFRQYFLKNYRLLGVFNLYGVKNKLFSHAKAPGSILTYKCEYKEHEYKFEYFAFKANMLSNVFQKIVYDAEKIIKINNTFVMKNPYVWRVLNNGDEYDVRVIGKMKTFPPISDRGYHYFRGYAVGNKKYPRPEFLEYKGGNLQEGYHRYLINYDNIPQMKEDKFERPRPLDEYLWTNKLLIKRTKNEKLSGAAFCAEPLIFCDDIHCLSDMQSKTAKDLKVLEAIFNSGIFKYYRFFASKEENGIKKELSKGDIMSFPVPNDISEENSSILLEKISKIENLLTQKYKENTGMDFEDDIEIKRVESEIDEIVFDLYQLDEVEQATVKYALEQIISSNVKDSMSVLYSDLDYAQYTNYIEKYFNNFLSASGLKLHKIQCISKNLYTLIYFSVDEEETESCSDIDIMKNAIDILGLSCIENINSELIVKKRLSGLTKNGFFVIKEKEPVNWTVMSAIKDADYFARIIISEEEINE